MGNFLQGPYWNDAETLWSRYGVRSNGECNLAIAFVTAYANRAESRIRGGRHANQFYAQLQEHLDDVENSGDKRVSWLVARVFTDEVIRSGHGRLLPNSEYLTEARLVAESPDYQFWTLQETAARYASLGERNKLDQLLGQQTGDTPQQQAALTKWREKAAEIANVNSERRAQEAIASKAAVVAELERRLAAAQQQGDQVGVAQYQRLVSEAQAEVSK
jgi:hypothetical protein